MKPHTLRVLSTIVVALGSLVSVAAHAQARDHISIAGSSTVFPFSSIVAEAFGKKGLYKTPVVESTGTGGGFKVFCAGIGAGTTDINDASRPITDGEKELCAKNGVTAIDEIRVGYDGIILAGVASAKPFDISIEQLWLATAKNVPVGGKWVPNPYKRWSDISPKLPNKAILIYGPAPNHGTRDAFVELVMDPSCQRTPEYATVAKDDRKTFCQTVREDNVWIDVSEDYALIMGKLAGDAKAMAVFTFSYLDQNRNKIKASTVNGVAASLETISSAKYPISRPLFIYVKRGHVGMIPGLSEFVQEFVSTRAAGKDGYLADKGLIPMPAKELAAQQAIAKSIHAAH
jgi:phosphate transport system substrate-binding protein